MAAARSVAAVHGVTVPARRQWQRQRQWWQRNVGGSHQKSNHVPYYLFIMIIHLGNMYYGVADTFLT